MATALSYPTISGVSGAPYLSALTDTANIQDTINYLYYGSTKGPVVTDGVYGMLTKLQTQITGLQTGINVHESAKWATTTTLAAVYAAGTADASAGTGISATITFSATGVQKIDSTTTNIALNDRVLVKDGTTALSGTTSVANGIYYVTTAPAVGVAGILTRALDSDNSVAGEMSEGDFLYVTDGDTNANEAYMLTTSSATGTNPSGGQGAIKIGTDSVTFTQFIGVGSYYIGSTQAAIATAPATGSPLAGLSTIGIQGGTSGTVTLNTVAVAGTNTITLPAITGTALITSGTTATAGYFDTGSTVPSGTTRLNYGGYLYSTRFYTDNIYTITGATATPNLFPDVTTGTVTIGDGVTTGTIKIGGTSTGAKTITIGTSTGSTTINGTVINSGDSVIQKSASFTVAAGEKNYHITGSSATVTVTLPTATAGRTLNFVNKSAAFQVVASASVVMPRTGTQSLGTLICSATVGSFATLVADGTQWYVMAGA